MALGIAIAFATAASLSSAPIKPAVSIDINTGGKGPGMVPVNLEIVAKAPVRSLTLKAFLDKVALPVQQAMSLNRGDRRRFNLQVNVPDKKPHWLYVEADVTLTNGERMTVAKSMVVNSSKDGAKRDSYETVRAEKRAN